MLKTFVVFLLLTSVAMAAEPLEIRSRLAGARGMEGRIAGTLLVEATNRGADLLGQVLIRPEAEGLPLLGIREVVVGDLQPGITRLVALPVSAPEPAVTAALAVAPVWLVECVVAGKGGTAFRIRGLQNPESPLAGAGGIR